MDTTSDDETIRLAEQHEYIDAALGFTLHPTIRAALTPLEHEICIADVSLGSPFSNKPDAGHRWLPSGTCSVRRVPPEDIISNTGLDPSLKGQFDIVAVRLLHAILRPEQWDVAIRNLHALLRAGGWLQWIDWDPLTARIAGVKAGAPDATIRELFHQFTDTMQTNKVGATYKIPNSLRAIGMQEDDSDMFTLNPEVRFTRNIATGAILTLHQSGTLDNEELNRIRTQVDEEIKLGNPLLWYDLWCHIARKPDTM